MRKPVKKTLVWVVGIFVAATLIIGCEEKNLSDTKSSIAANKFLAVENRQLRKEIENLKEQHKKEIKYQKGLLEECQQKKKDLEELLGKDFKDLMDAAFKNLAEENIKLREENETLKAQIKELQATVRQLEK